jgi:hypothetical protein
MSISVVLLLTIPSSVFSLSDRIVLLIPYVTIMNAIACHVFRHVRLGNFREMTLSGLDFVQGPQSQIVGAEVCGMELRVNTIDSFSRDNDTDDSRTDSLPSHPRREQV